MKSILNLFFSLSLFSGTAFAQYCTITVDPMNATVCLGDSVLVTSISNLINSGQQFDFNVGALPAGWTTEGGQAFSEPCGPNPTGTPYYWASTAGAGTPYIATAAFDVSCGGIIEFDMMYSIQGQSSPCEGPDQANEGVELQYSLDGGVTWIPIEYYQPNGVILPQNPGTVAPGAAGATPFTTWNTFTVTIPPGATTTGTMFRWVQENSSGSAFDNWGLDNIIINAMGAPCGSTTVVNWSNGLTDTESFYVYPTGDTTFVAYVYDTNGVYHCQSDTIFMSIYPDNMTYSVPDTVYSYCPTTHPLVEVTNFGNSFGPYGVTWTNIPSTNNPENLPTSGTEHDTIPYYLEITDGCNYIRYDTVILVVNQLLEIDTLMSFISNACNPTGAVSAMVSGITMNSGQPYYNWTGPDTIPGIISVDGTVAQNLPPGWYYFTVEDDVCIESDSVYVDVEEPPIAQLSANPMGGCAPVAVTFTNSSQNTNNYYWDFGNGQTTTTTSTNNQNQTYVSSANIMLIAYASPNCADTAYVSIEVIPCGCTDPEATNYNPLATIDDESCVYPEPIIVVPNVFTPNNDGTNDVFALDVTFYTNIELVILNRWGNTMYTSAGLNPGWEGRTNTGAEAGEGTYFYKYIVTSIEGTLYEGHGFLELVRD